MGSSTILYFYKQSGDWDDAFAKACEFKKKPQDIQGSQDALELAKRTAQPLNN